MSPSRVCNQIFRISEFTTNIGMAIPNECGIVDPALAFDSFEVWFRSYSQQNSKHTNATSGSALKPELGRFAPNNSWVAEHLSCSEFVGDLHIFQNEEVRQYKVR
jgi:hypothetical protein